MNVYVFDKIIYNGNIEKDFYLFCCSKDKMLLVYILKHIFFFILSFFSLRAANYYRISYNSYLKKVKNLNLLLQEFKKKNFKKINKWYLNSYKNSNVVLSKSPRILVKLFLQKEDLVAPELTDDYKLDFFDYNEILNNFKNEFDEFFCSKYNEINLVKAKFVFIKKGNLFINYKDTYFKKIFCKLIFCLIPILLSILLVLISFQFTSIYIDKQMILNFLHEPKLIALNALPILLLLCILLLITKRLWLSFGFTSFLLIMLGISNKTKLFYRDDVLKFEDILLIKEALLMTKRYEIIIRWYTIVSILFCIILVILLKRSFSKIKLKNYAIVLLSALLFIISIVSYNKIFTNVELYDSVGNTDNINIWIGTRQSQIRGLVYPFIFSSTEIVKNEPNNYDAIEVKNILNKYTYENIPEDKKVNIISVMLEAYNDFSKFETITFTDDVYDKLHKIEKNSLSGNIIVDIFGGGTIQTERRFLTGYYDLPSFRKPTNSYVRFFKEQGYQVNAYHPVYGAFYNRNTGNYNIGFDVYWNYENRFNIYNGWSGFASDKELYNEMIKDFEQNKNKNKFYFVVTYQNHGPYSEQTPSKVYIKNNEITEGSFNVINNYFSGIKDTNDSLYDLVKYIDSIEEPTILIFFGDHNPYLGADNITYKESGITLDLSTIEGFENYYSIPYVIHANDGARNVYNKDFKGKLETISSNYIMNELFEYIGLKGNEYLQYTSDIKNEISVINNVYYKENNLYIAKKNSTKENVLDEFLNVNYYWANTLK